MFSEIVHLDILEQKGFMMGEKKCIVQIFIVFNCKYFSM